MIMKADIIRRIKEEEVPVSHVAKEHRIHEPSTIPVRAHRG